MVKQLGAGSRLALSGAAGVALAVWGAALGFDAVVVVAIAVGAALPVWVLSRLAVIEAPSGSEVLGRELDQIVARHQVEAVRDSGERFADSPRY